MPVTTTASIARNVLFISSSIFVFKNTSLFPTLYFLSFFQYGQMKRKAISPDEYANRIDSVPLPQHCTEVLDGKSQGEVQDNRSSINPQ
jgi:hypothetical protein